MSLALGAVIACGAKSYEVSSPSGRITATVRCDSALTWSATADGQMVLSPSRISMTLGDGQVWGRNPRVAKAVKTKVDEMIPSPFTGWAEMADRYNGLTLRMKGGWSVEFRAYDDGLAYRFTSDVKSPYEIMDEQVEFLFPADFAVTAPYVRSGHDGDWDSQFYNSYENTYTSTQLSGLNPGRLAFTPLSVNVSDSLSLVIADNDVWDYPGLLLYNPESKAELKGKFAAYPTRVEEGGYNGIQGIVHERAPYIAKVTEARTFPWRFIVIGDDKTIASNNFNYLLAEPSRIADISWIKPGKVSWDWWNDWNITGVDFEAGVNTDTYLYYIDFTADHGIEYVILDDGWAAGTGTDLMKVNPNIDLAAIIEHGRKKGVDIILWAGYTAFARDMDQVCRHYSQMGVKGFKVDFEDRADQLMTAFNHKAAETAAKYNLVLDIHGAFKPSGINRTWPNVVNVEGVFGLENAKMHPLEKNDLVQYDTDIPFLRQLGGPMDYTQGAMLNATRSGFRPNWQQPMSPGTRCHQLGLYMILNSPLSMMCDSPTNYMREKECTDFIAGIPTVWDETVVLSAKKGEYIATARRKGDKWYIGGITNWTPRELSIDLTPLGLNGQSTMTLFTDGVNAHRNATDYRKQTSQIGSDATLDIKLAPGGGFAAVIEAGK